MNARPFYNDQKNSQSLTGFWITAIALFFGLVLSILSWMELCVEHCSANQDYRLFGLPFAIVGITFFIVLNAIHLSSRKFPFLSLWTGWLVASALGAELMFILVQKYQIGNWCPVCLSIAFSILIAGIALSSNYIKALYRDIKQRNRGNIMGYIKQGLTSLSFIVLGFLMAFVGVSKPNEAEAAMEEMKTRLAFGTLNSPVEVYFVSDWYCPSCKKIEPQIEKILPEIKSKSTFYFIDYPIHKKSLNFTPYNLAFLVYEKPNYLIARKALSDLSEDSETPNDNDILKIAKDHKLTFNELSYLEVKTGIDFFDKIVEKFDLSGTPTVVITNTKTNKVVKLEGRDQISEEKIIKAVDSMNEH
ncbi:MAG: thioredoxin domain-containing protein [Candidatus Protochlamydia sp.]|nr:thioredoxin domain-containing protein [Candidatus Protochlamydia sp.]